MHGLLALLVGAAAWAVGVDVQATLDPETGRVVGVLRADAPITLRDPLSDLPLPSTDLVRARTFPGRVDRGSITWEALEGEAQAWRFETRLPQRFGALGVLPGRGVWANGGWYPQPVLESSGMPVLDWNVVVELPPNMPGVLNDSVGYESITWTGRAQRVALAVLVEGAARVLEEDGLELVLLEEGRSRRERDSELIRIAKAVWTLPSEGRVVVVEAPMLRRLVRSGPGIVFLSDHAFRLNSSMVHLHRAAVARALLEAGLPMNDAWLRAIAASPLSDRAAANLRAEDAVGVFERWGLPPAHTFFYDGRTLFLSDVFGEIHASDLLKDDLEQVMRPRVPGSVVAHWLEILGGEDVALGISEGLLQGLDLEEAMEAEGLDGGLAQAWKAPMPEQDLSLELRGGARPSLALSRRVEGAAAPVPVVVEVDGERQVWLTGEGSDELHLETEERVRKVVVDPDRAVAQLDRSNDRWPRGVWVLPGAYVSAIHLTDRRFEGQAWMTLRRPHNTHRLAQLILSHNAESTFSVEGLLGRYLGPYRDRIRREHLVWGSIAAGILEPEFRPTDTGRYHTDLGLGYSWDTRVSPYFPERGHRFWAQVHGGGIPASDVSWARARAGLMGVRMTWPGHAVAGRLGVGFADGNVPHKLLPLGGAGGLTSVPSNTALGRFGATVAGEYRLVLLDGLSIHLPFYWLSQVQLTTGGEAGWLGQESELGNGPGLFGVGATAGVNVVADVLGVRPVIGGISLGRLVFQEPEFLQGEAPVMVMLRVSQAY